MQYDFVAGFFGTQASIFSRIIYICVGLATFYFIFMMFKYRGSVKIFDRKRKEVDYVQTRFTPQNIDSNVAYDKTPQGISASMFQNINNQATTNQNSSNDGDILS